jgi:hypothetical protein
MRRVRLWLYVWVVVGGLGQCLASAMPAAATQSFIPFVVENLGDQAYYIICVGPWQRSSLSSEEGDFETPGIVAPHHNLLLYEAEVIPDFPPYGNWECSYYGPVDPDSFDPNLQPPPLISSVDFCLSTWDDGVPEVSLTIPSNEGALQVQVDPPGPPCEAVPPSALTALSGSARQDGVKLTGKVNVGTPLALDHATVTLEALLYFVDRGEEFVSGLPLVLTAKRGSTATEASFYSAPHTQPLVRLDFRQRTGQPAEFKLKLEQGTLQGVAGSTLRFTIDDGVNTPLVVEGEVAWEGRGKNRETDSLKVKGLLPIEPRPAP